MLVVWQRFTQMQRRPGHPQQQARAEAQQQQQQQD